VFLREVTENVAARLVYESQQSSAESDVNKLKMLTISVAKTSDAELLSPHHDTQDHAVTIQSISCWQECHPQQPDCEQQPQLNSIAFHVIFIS